MHSINPTRPPQITELGSEVAQVLALPLTRCVALGKSLSYAERFSLLVCKMVICTW